MAMLSTHPAIVTIYQAGVAGDGRPYLVMEYCPRPNLQLRYRAARPFSIAEALRVGVQVAGAVETAHRAGVLHRDIKPANILVTDVQPAGADRLRHRVDDRRHRRGVRDVDPVVAARVVRRPAAQRSAHGCLGAGRDALHAARRAFAVRETGRAQLQRRSHRADRARCRSPRWAVRTAPESLQRVLERAMAKNPDDRYPSAVAFARALQKVQIELAHSVTPIDIVDDHPPAEDLDDDGDGLTRVREIVSIDPDAAAFTRPSATTERKSRRAAARCAALRLAGARGRRRRGDTDARSGRERRHPRPTTGPSSGRRRWSRRTRRHPLRPPVAAPPGAGATLSESTAASGPATPASDGLCGSPSRPSPPSWSSSRRSSA